MEWRWSASPLSRERNHEAKIQFWAGPSAKNRRQRLARSVTQSERDEPSFRALPESIAADDDPARTECSVTVPPRAVIAPAWGTAGGPWNQILAVWPGTAEVYLGAGLGDRRAGDAWTLDEDVAELVELVTPDDVLVAPGWAAELGLRAARYVSPLAIMLWSPPVGVDFLDSVAQAEREPTFAIELMAKLGGPADYWQRIKDSPWATSRAISYLKQDPLTAATSIPNVRVFAGWPGSRHPTVSTPANWHWLAADDAGDAALRLLALIEET